MDYGNISYLDGSRPHAVDGLNSAVVLIGDIFSNQTIWYRGRRYEVLRF